MVYRELAAYYRVLSAAYDLVLSQEHPLVQAVEETRYVPLELATGSGRIQACNS